MFKCQISGKNSKPGEKPLKIIAEKRNKEYFKFDKYGNNVKIGEGWEIVKEILVIPSVYKEIIK